MTAFVKTLTKDVKLTSKEREVINTQGIIDEHSLFDAMCLWEAVISVEISAWAKVKAKTGYIRDDPTTHDLSDMTVLEKAIYDWHAEVGSVAMRLITSDWLPALQLAWLIAFDVYGFEDCFDYEFCPWFLEHCIDLETMTVRHDWIVPIRKIQKIRAQEQMTAEGWAIFNDGTPDARIARYDEMAKFPDDTTAWRHVLQRAIKNRNPVHRQALRSIQKQNPDEFIMMSIFCYGAFDVNLAADLDAHPW